MSYSILPPAPEDATVGEPARVALDARQPKRLDHQGAVLQVVTGHVDVFVVDMSDDSAIGARHHLFRVESGGILLDLDNSAQCGGIQTQIIAVGGPGTEVAVLPHAAFQSFDLIEEWIARLAQLVAGPNPNWEMREVADAGETEIASGERRRGPVRNIVWISLKSGTAKLMGLDPILTAAVPPIPLTSGMWIEAGQSECRVVGSPHPPDAGMIWRTVDQFHRCVNTCLRDYLLRGVDRETQRLARRDELTTAQTYESFDRLAAIAVRRFDRAKAKSESAAPLLEACQMVADELRAPIDIPPRPATVRQDFAELTEIARAARLRVRQTLLRGTWWKQDVGPLVSWHGERRDPVGLIRAAGGHYTMIDPTTGARRKVDRSLALELGPEAA